MHDLNISKIMEKMSLNDIRDFILWTKAIMDEFGFLNKVVIIQ